MKRTWFRPILLGILSMTVYGRGFSLAADPPQVAFVTNNPDPFWSIVEAGCRKAEKETGVRVVFRKQVYGTNQQREPGRRQRAWRQVGRWPMVWKEVVAERGLRFNWFGWLVLAVITAVFGAWACGTIVLGAITRLWGEIQAGHFKVVWLVGAGLSAAAGFGYHPAWALTAASVVCFGAIYRGADRSAGVLTAVLAVVVLAAGVDLDPTSMAAAVLLGAVTNAIRTAP